MAKRGSTAEVDQEGQQDAEVPMDGQEGNGKATKRARQVEYLLEEWDESDLPKRAGGGNRGPRDSVLDKKVLEVIEHYPDGTKGKVILVGRYGNGGQGGISAATTLRKRWSERDKGIAFVSRMLEGDDKTGTRGLFVKYSPGEDTDGGTDE